MKSDNKFSLKREMFQKTGFATYIQKIILGITLLFSIDSYGQKLIESRQTSYYTYIYKITNKEAKKIYKSKIRKIDSTFFHTLVDYYPTDSQYNRALPQGHYLKTFAEKNVQKYYITTVQLFDVFIFNNNTDLCIQVFDLQGNIVKDADVAVRWKKLHFDKNTQSYLDKKSNQKGLLCVTYKGFTAYFNLARKYNNSFLARGTRQIVYGTPVKYVWMPLYFVTSMPVDIINSIVDGYTQGTIRKIKSFLVNSYNHITCLFDDSNCNYSKNYKFRNRHTGYIVFNKPKYQPRDTVKFKAFLLTRKGKPVDKNIRVVLQNFNRDIELANLMPYNKGGYKYEFYLHDSLQLQLDRNYTISLILNKRKEYISGSFKFEDYELSKHNLALRIDKKEHFRNTTIKLFVKGTDENDLNLMDARVEILLTPKLINRFFDNHVFIPDTLLFIKRKLNPLDETEIILSDSAFPKANFDYTINVRLLTSDNESVSEKEEIAYYFESEKFNIELKIDSIYFEYLKNGRKEHKQVIITSKDNFGNKSEVYKGITPCQIEVNPYFASYTIRTDSVASTIDISKEPSMLQCFSERTSDSIYIAVNNPRKIPFIYNIYKLNSQQANGYSDSLNFKQKTSSHQNYFISLRYLWGGKVREENYKIPLNDKKLNISVTQPKIVYPGQKTKIDILVTDTEGNPVEGVDITAFSLTKKFDYAAQQLPYLGEERKNKKVINNFSFKEFKLVFNAGLKLDYESWKILAGIDSIEYYRFIYPHNGIYRFEYTTNDSITQFAPFVTYKGSIIPVHVVYVDSRPVYFSWSTNAQPYSFIIDSGCHQIKLRTAYREILIDSMYFNYGKKLIFCIDYDSENNNIKISKTKAWLSDYEKQLLYKYVFPYRNNFGEHFAFIEQNGMIQNLSPKLKYQRYNFAGPVAGRLTFHLVDSFSTTFDYEPYSEYEFLPSLLKTRSIDSKRYPDYLVSFNAKTSFSDVVLTRAMIEKQWEDYLNAKRYATARYKHPNFTNQGAGKLLINIKTGKDSLTDIPLNILVFRYNNHEFLRVYPGNTSTIHELQQGYHKLIFFYSGAKYHIEDSVYILPNGLNYYEFEQPYTFKKDTFSVYVSHIIEETLFKPKPYYEEERKELKQIYAMYQQQFIYKGIGDIVEGYVFDTQEGDPLPGVNVVIKGTTYGTVTNLDGYYSIKVPPGYNTLNFSFVGYVSEDRYIGNNKLINVNLTPDILQLDEIVVIGYGTAKKSLLTASVATVNSNSLINGITDLSSNISEVIEGKAAGIIINSIEGAPGNNIQIAIRGVSTPVLFDKIPLFIIDGNVYTGDISEIDPSFITKIEILKDTDALAIYGTRGANGVVIIETQQGTFKNPSLAMKGAEYYDDTFLEAAGQSNSIRNNFSDFAFWEPSLTTNKEGKVSFEVVFPDDITSWQTFYLAMNNKRQAGQYEGLIKSYKPLMAQLAAPRFLVQGDSSYAIGKVLNYTPDSVKLETKIELGETELIKNSVWCSNSLIDTFLVNAINDSVNIKYSLKTEDDYFDGEQRTIPVFPKGLEATKGNFFILDKDTTIQLQFDSLSGKVCLYARADILDVIEDEISHLIKYKYSCNEQLASKLKALLAEKNISYFKGERFRDDHEIEKLISLLKKHQKKNELWGWWKDAEESLWISLHVLEALMHAEQLGYKTNLNKGRISEQLIWELENSADFFERIRILNILSLLGAKINFHTYIADLEKTRKISLNGLLNLMLLKQHYGIACNLDTLEFYKHTTLFGNIFYSDDHQLTNVHNNDIQNTLLAYKIFKADSLSDPQKLTKIRNYLLENRKNGYWRNTFESAQIIETVLPDLLKNQSEVKKPQLTLKGNINMTVTEFPFEMQINPAQITEISKSGDFPVYLTSYQKYWNNEPSMKSNDFEISTFFINAQKNTLKAGQETKLITKVKVKKDAEYVMINIPIPGGCSYTDKKSNIKNESHREYFKNETTIFCDYLPKGEYSFEIGLNSRYTGVYTVNPAKIELMYFPVFNANNETKSIVIK